MSEPLKPGTLCFLVSLVEMPDLLGRVVEVEAGPMIDSEDGLLRYRVRASWTAERFPGAELLAQREHLLPIAGPAPKDRTKETHE